MANYLNIKGIQDVFSTTPNNEINDNLIEFFDWALLNKGNYFNVTLGELSQTGQDMSQLRMSSDPYVASGVVWEGFRGNWVWQSGVSYSPAPLVGTNTAKPGISGVYVDGDFYPSTTSGTYAHKVDYYNGRIIFNNPIPTGSLVQAEYSYKYINMVYAASIPWLREVQYDTLDVPASFSVTDKGDYTIPAESRLQLPAIAIEIVPRRTLRGYQLGGGQYVDTDVLFHCLAEDEFTRNKLVDIVSLQNDKSLLMFDTNKIAESGAFPLNVLGVPNAGALRYPELLTYFPRGGMRLKNSNVQGMRLVNSNFYAGIVRMTIETIEPTI